MPPPPPIPRAHSLLTPSKGTAAAENCVVQAVEARREGAVGRAHVFKRAQGANHLMAPVAARKLRAEVAKVGCLTFQNSSVGHCAHRLHKHTINASFSLCQSLWSDL